MGFAAATDEKTLGKGNPMLRQPRGGMTNVHRVNQKKPTKHGPFQYTTGCAAVEEGEFLEESKRT